MNKWRWIALAAMCALSGALVMLGYAARAAAECS